jgi:hypothetical protein
MLSQITLSLENPRAQVNANLGTIKWVATGLMVWFAVYQVMPIYFGYRMLSDKVVEGSIEERLEDEREEMAERVKEAEEKAEEAAERAEDAADDAAAAA